MSLSLILLMYLLALLCNQTTQKMYWLKDTQKDSVRLAGLIFCQGQLGWTLLGPRVCGFLGDLAEWYRMATLTGLVVDMIPYHLVHWWWFDKYLSLSSRLAGVGGGGLSTWWHNGFKHNKSRFQWASDFQPLQMSHLLLTYWPKPITKLNSGLV